MNIYEISSNYQALMDMADDPELDEQVFYDTWESIDGEFETKCDQYARVMKNLDSQVCGLKTEIERLTKRKQTIENSIDRMKATLQQAMEITEKPKFKTELFSFTIQNNPPSVSILDEKKVPLSFQIPQPNKIDKTAIKEWLKAGNECDFAELTQGRSLRIR